MVKIHVHTIRMPDLAQKPHLRRAQRVVLRKGEFGWEDAPLVGSLFGSWDVSLPDEHVCIVERPGEDAFGLGFEDLVGFVTKAFASYCRGHGESLSRKYVEFEIGRGRERKVRIEE
jgi:hypothetical protein